MSILPKRGLVRQNARLLVGVFILFELLISTVVITFVMVPMARRSANDLASLVVLSAQTWSELPPATRPDFERELLSAHQLALRAEVPREDEHQWHGPYLYFVEQALSRRNGMSRHLVREEIAGEPWLWTTIPVGKESLAVGFPMRRVTIKPVFALLVSSLIGVALAILAAFWLAHRITEPLRRLEQAASELGQGEIPALLDESGPGEIAALARRFNVVARQVRELIEARTVLLAGLSHDLRTPLARMRLAIALLESRPSPKILAQLEHDVTDMDALIGDVLSLAKGLTGEKRQRIALRNLLSECISDSSGAERIRLDCPSLEIETSPLGLKRVINNLLENALRYGHGEPVDLLVRAPSGGALEIRICDRGQGIPDTAKEKVLHPFFRLDDARSSETGGAGLGLAIVRQLCQANAWQIDILDRPAGGTEILLRL